MFWQDSQTPKPSWDCTKKNSKNSNILSICITKDNLLKTKIVRLVWCATQCTPNKYEASCSQVYVITSIERLETSNHHHLHSKSIWRPCRCLKNVGGHGIPNQKFWCCLRLHPPQPSWMSRELERATNFSSHNVDVDPLLCIDNGDLVCIDNNIISFLKDRHCFRKDHIIHGICNLATTTIWPMF
jgi:hypothetical protein